MNPLHEHYVHLDYAGLTLKGFSINLKPKRGLEVKYRLWTSNEFSGTVANDFRFRLIKDLRKKFLSRSTNLTKVLKNKVVTKYPQYSEFLGKEELEVVEDLEFDTRITDFIRAFRRTLFRSTFSDIGIHTMVNHSWEQRMEQVRKKVQHKELLGLTVKEIEKIEDMSTKSSYVAFLCDKGEKYSSARYEEVQLVDGKIRYLDNKTCEAAFSNPLESFIDNSRLNSVFSDFSTFNYLSTSNYEGKCLFSVSY